MSSTTYATDTYIRTTAEQLWAALTRGELTRRWYFRLQVESSWQPDAPVVYRDDAGQALVAGTVLSVVPPAWSRPPPSSSIPGPARSARPG